MYWQKPITPPIPRGGYICMQNDDGNIGDYTMWFIKAKEKSMYYSSWNPYSFVSIVSAINSGNIGIGGHKMSALNLREMNSYGVEIVSHGYKHYGLGIHRTQHETNTGDTAFEVHNIARVGVNREYVITDGTNSENVFVAEKSGNDVILQSALQNGYPFESSFYMSEESVKSIHLGKVNEYLQDWGIPETPHHVYTWHANHGLSIQWLEDAGFESARGNGQNIIKPNDKVNKYAMPSYGIPSSVWNGDLSWIDNVIDSVEESGGLVFLYAHGETSQGAVNAFEHIIDTAIAKGIRFVSHTQAVNILEGWGVFAD